MKNINLNLKQLIFILILFINLNQPGLAQEVKDDLKRPFQLTFIYPVGSNGIQSGKYLNHVSINMLAGISRGVEGAEIGGLANISLGHIDGVQAAGLFNSSSDYMRGLQLGGLSNINKGEMVGVQASGIANVNLYKVNGLQLGGIANLSTQTVDGAQISGITNVSTQNTYGVQLSGITNVTAQKLTGGQIGLVNYAQSVKGFQIGLINVSDTVEKGAVLGLFSFVRHGYTRIEIETNETFYINTTIKNGLPWLYNIYTVSFKTSDNKSYWAPGIGLGSMFPVGKNKYVNVDLITRHVNEDKWWTEQLNMLNTLKVNFSYRLADRVEFYGGPSFNVTVSGIKDAEGNVIGESFSPSWGLSSKTYKKNQVKTYLGFNFGIRL